VPKAFVPLAGRPMVEWSEAAIAAAGLPCVRVVPEGHDGVTGGATRSQSVRNGLRALAADVDAVVVHDAARPLAPPALFTACLEALAGADGAVAATRVTDTVREVEAGVSVRTLDRSRLWAMQTPQAFRRDVLERALDVGDDVLAQATDDAWLVERAGGRVVVVEALASNFKVTTAHDLAVAEWLLASKPC
jgi:2-C-methyl-D-erythritol 4-phosphate cytidylyltransferase